MGRSRALANGVGKGSMEQQVRSKQRVADHGEVFTPGWMVDAMLDLVKEETERIDSRFLEPACGSGNFLVKILARKLAAVDFVYGKSDFERRHYALLALMSIYGIELLDDNIAECRANMLYADLIPGASPGSTHRAWSRLRLSPENRPPAGRARLRAPTAAADRRR